MPFDVGKISLVEEFTEGGFSPVVITLCFRIMTQRNGLFMTPRYLAGHTHIDLREATNTDAFFGTVERVT